MWELVHCAPCNMNVYSYTAQATSKKHGEKTFVFLGCGGFLSPGGGGGVTTRPLTLTSLPRKHPLHVINQERVSHH